MALQVDSAWAVTCRSIVYRQLILASPQETADAAHACIPGTSSLTNVAGDAAAGSYCFLGAS